MKTFTADLTKTKTETTTIEVEAKNEDEAGMKLQDIVRRLNRGEADADIADNLELNDEDWDWDNLECTSNCDEDEEE